MLAPRSLQLTVWTGHQNHTNPRTNEVRIRGDSDCYRCGGKQQPSKFKECECHFCKKKGHLASVCRKKLAQGKTKPRERTNRIDEGTTDGNDQLYALYRVSSGSSKPILVPVTLDGVSIEIELDTGTSVSLVDFPTTTRKGHHTKPLSS